MYLGSLYRPLDKIDNDCLEEFNLSLERIMSNRNGHVLIGGGFNCGDIENDASTPWVQKRLTIQQLKDIIGEHCLTQVVNIRIQGMPPIGKADHDLVYIEYDI